MIGMFFGGGGEGQPPPVGDLLRFFFEYVKR